MKDQHHTRPLTWSDALQTVESVNKALGSAMRLLTKATSRPVYQATYRYGDAIIDADGKLRPPCSSPSCKVCTDLQEACCNDLPFALVLTQCFEIHLQTDSPRTIPLRLLGPGESFGLFELLDKLYPESTAAVQVPRWRVVAGAKSVHITSPFCTEPLGKSLRTLLPDDITKEHFPRFTVADKQVSKKLTNNPYLFIRYLEKAALRNDQSLLPWTATALIFPSSALLPALRSRGAVLDAAKEFLLQIHGTAWIQSRNLRLRDVEAGEIEQHLGTYKNALKHPLARAIQHIVAIGRGDLPAFVPFSKRLMAGPFTTVQTFFLSSELRDKLAQPTFPAILQPCHLGNADMQSPFGYFSLSSPSLIGPEKSFEKEFATDLVGNLKTGNFMQEFGVSLHTSLGDDPTLRKDFADQFAVARDQWRVTENNFFGDFKQGFTLRFMRIEKNAATGASAGAML